MRAALVTGSVLALLMLSACGGGPAGPGAGTPTPAVVLGPNDTVFCGVFNTGTPIEIKDNKFNPPDVTIQAGGEVDWQNNDSVTHVIKFDTGTTCGTVMAGTVKKVRFAGAGLFPYHCTIHADMRGTVTVQ